MASQIPQKKKKQNFEIIYKKIELLYISSSLCKTFLLT